MRIRHPTLLERRNFGTPWKYHQRYLVERPMRHPESEEVPAVYGLIHLFCGGRPHGWRRQDVRLETRQGAENEHHRSIWGDKRPLGRNSRPILVIGWNRCASILLARIFVFCPWGCSSPNYPTRPTTCRNESSSSILLIYSDQRSCPSGSRLSSSRKVRHWGSSLSIKATNRSEWCRSKK